MSTTALSDLKASLDPRAWSEDPVEIAGHVSDWRGRYRGDTPLLLKPGSSEEVSRILAACNAAGIAVLPQGGNTGLVGGSTPRGEVLISLKRMNAIRAIDTDNDSLTCEAGAILEAVQGAARDAGKLFPLSLGAQGSAMIGGLISTNAGGVHVLRYGMMRELVLGLEAVLPDGRMLSDLSGLRKDNTGYDLKQLFIGAEGTLGVVTAATLKLFARPASTAVAVAAVDSPRKAVELLGHMKDATGGAVAAFELMPKPGLDMVLAHVPGARHPLEGDPAWTVLIELTSAEKNRAAALLESALEGAFEKALLTDAVIAQSETQAHEFWMLRSPFPKAKKFTERRPSTTYPCRFRGWPPLWRKPSSWPKPPMNRRWSSLSGTSATAMSTSMSRAASQAPMTRSSRRSRRSQRRFTTWSTNTTGPSAPSMVSAR